jgi:hypothetical protein
MNDNWMSINLVAGSVGSLPARPTLSWAIAMML